MKVVGSDANESTYWQTRPMKAMMTLTSAIAVSCHARKGIQGNEYHYVASFSSLQAFARLRKQSTQFMFSYSYSTAVDREGCWL